MTTELERVHAEELKREEKRNYMFYTRGKGRYLVQLDSDLAENDETDDPAWLSDGGAAAERMYAALDGDYDPGHAHTVDGVVIDPIKRHAYANRLRRNMPEVVPVFLFVTKNGKNRRRSILCLIPLIVRKIKGSITSLRSRITHTLKKS